MRISIDTLVLTAVATFAASGLAEAIIPNPTIPVPEPGTGLLLLAGLGGGILYRRFRR